ncbi:hypothetical protein SIPHO063v1_p0001 [Vibrio phage PS10B.1]|nr:hypothetical protein SIPHO063v1_p0001 [Vibrio phage PS10B.1]
MGENATEDQKNAVKALSIEMSALQQQLKATDRVKELKDELSILGVELSQGSVDARAYAAALNLGENATEDQKNAVKALSIEMSALQQEIKSGETFKKLNQDLKVLQLTTVNQARSAAQLRAEYALGAKATQSQIEKVRELSGALFDAERDRAKVAELYKPKLSVFEVLEQKRQIVLQYQEQELGDAQAHAAALVSLERQTLSERASITSSGLGSILALQEAYGDDSSGIYRTLLTVQKAATLYSVLLSSQESIGKAWASAPFPANLPAVATATVETGALAATVQALTPSFATGGYVQGAGTGTSDSINARLSMGEFVMPARETKRYAPELNDMRSGNYRGGGNSVPNIQIVNQTTGKIDSASTSWVDEDTVRVLIREEVPGIVSAEFNDEYSNTNKSIQSQYTLQRKF